MMDWESARQEMVEIQLRRRGIRDERVLAAMAAVPRERFVDASELESAYDDRALPIDFGQTISQPYVVARMTEMLDIRPGMKVLEVGTGTGYQAAVAAKLGADLWTLERIAELSLAAEIRLQQLGLHRVHFVIGDGSLGYSEEAPFDRILVTAASPAVPPTLLAQLRISGLMAIPVGGIEEQVLVRVEKQEHRIVEQPIFPCRFVRLIGAQAWSDRSFQRG